MTYIEQGEFKGHPTIGIKNTKEDNYHLVAFGIKKAKVIVEHIGAIKKFVAECEAKEQAAAADTSKLGISAGDLKKLIAQFKKGK